MTALRAQAVWCEWSIDERLGLLSPWLAEQSPLLRDELCLLQCQAPAAEQSSITELADGRQLHEGHGPVGLVVISTERQRGSAAALAHIIWACALGNAVHYSSDDAELMTSVAALRDRLSARDPDLSELLRVSEQTSVERHSCVVIPSLDLHVVVAPSAEPSELLDDLAGLSQGAVLWVNHALHVEIQLRLPDIGLLEDAEALQSKARSGVFLVACGSVRDTLRRLQGDRRRTSLYSGDWREVQHSCAMASARAVPFAVNNCSEPLLGLAEARSLYQRPAQTVISHAD